MGTHLHCSICYELKTHACYLYPCGHDFNETCIDRLQEKICPECRTPFTDYAPAYTVRNTVGHDMRYASSLIKVGIISPLDGALAKACIKKDHVFVKATFENCLTITTLMSAVKIALEHDLEATKEGLQHIESGFHCNEASDNDLAALHCLATAFELSNLKNHLATKYPQHQYAGTETPLHFVAYQGWDKALSNLLDSGFNASLCTPKKWTPLHYAAQYGHVNCCKILLERMENPNPPALNKWTPLHSAAQGGHASVTKLILTRAQNPDLQDRKGWTPLHIAIADGHIEVVKVLLEYHASLFVRNNVDLSPLDLVHQQSERGYSELGILVLNHAKSQLSEK